MDVCQGEKAAGALGEEEDAGLHLGSTIVDAGWRSGEEVEEWLGKVQIGK